MAAAPPKLATGAVLLVVVWIIAYWITPAPGDNPVRISFGDAPSQADAAPPRVTQDPAPNPKPAPKPEQAPAPAPERDPTPADTALEDVTQEELSQFEEQRALPADDPIEVIPPTFRIYTSKEGDTFQSIAQRFFGSTGYWRAIATANPNVDPNRLGPGRSLNIPLDPDNIQGKVAAPEGEPTTPPTPQPEHTIYIVQKGDTLSEISKALYGKASLWQRIVDANPHIDPDRLKPGSTLKIPPPPAPSSD